MNIHILYNPAISLLDIQPKEMYTYVHQNICIRMFIEVLFISLVPLINVNSAPEFIHPSAYLRQDVREIGTCLSPKGWVMRVFLGTLCYTEVPPSTSLEKSDCLSGISTWGSSTKYPLNFSANTVPCVACWSTHSFMHSFIHFCSPNAKSRII